MQEEKLSGEIPLPPENAVASPSLTMPDPSALEAIADRLVRSEQPLLLPQYVGRHEGGFQNVIDLAETIGAAVWDANSALNFPNRHPLCVTFDRASYEQTDLVLGVDVRDWEKETRAFKVTERTVRTITPPHCDWVEIGMAEVGISKWSMDYARWQPCSVRALGDTSLAIPELTRARESARSRERAARGKDRPAQGRDRQTP